LPRFKALTAVTQQKILVILQEMFAV